jgi:hypothetical protein
MNVTFSQKLLANAYIGISGGPNRSAGAEHSDFGCLHPF